MSEEIIEVVPWGLHPLPKWVITELENRAKEYGQNPVDINSPSIYSGPRTAWARFFSNGISKNPLAENKDGFLLGGVYGFNDSYGINEENMSVIGVDAKGNPHKIPNDRSNVLGIDGQEKKRMDFPNRPPPSLESVSVETGGTSQTFPGLCRKITIKWKCYSLAQLNYMIPYFLTPRITCVVEWGWNNYDPVSLVDLTDLDWVNNMFVDPSYSLQWIKESKGNYDAGLGFIVDYGYSVNEDGSYDCSTTILNANRLIEGEQVNDKQTFKKKGQSQIPVKGFKEFIEKNLSSIDSNKSSYVKLRKKYEIGEKIIDENGNVTGIRDNVKERVFRISSGFLGLGSNTDGFWIRMDLLQDIINSFFQITMKGQKEADIRKFDISDVRIVGNPLLKSADANVLVPNQYAPRFTYQQTSNVAPEYFPENGIYESLFQEKMNTISQEYPISNKFDNLREAINPFGDSFPVYQSKKVYNDDGDLTQTLESGYWGNLKDLFINVDYFKDIVKNNDSLLRIFEQLLQGINESLCQICQLRLIPTQYGNSIYSVYDENLPGITSAKDALNIPRITLGAISSAFMKSAKFDVKVSQEQMNQLVFQSANPSQDPDGSITTKTTKANPIVSRYSAGDRLYRKGELKKTAESDDLTGLSPEERRQAERERAAEREAEEARKVEEQKQEEAERKKKEQARSEKNKDAFWIYYASSKTYIICEKTKDFLNYVLTLPNKKSSYLNHGIMPNTKLTIELQGISGIDYLSQFVIDHAPESYNYETAIWQVADITQNIEDKNWTTTIVAQVRPLTVL